MANEFQDKHVVVTGGTGALGAAVVSALIRQGAVCHVPVRGGEPGTPAGDRVHLIGPCDLSDESSVCALYAGVPELWASIQVAGGFAMSPITETSLTDFERMFQLNAVTCFLACREAIRVMRARGGGGRIVNVAARPAVVPAGGMVAYSAAKAAVAALTGALAVEARADGILVNAVLPSIIDSPANRRAMPDADHATWPRPEELAQVMLSLASPTNTVTSGALVPVYGHA
jgi:NAD(P)-dependent dehydrogenase (short-subunit alcohol dehydrogenase family)